MGRERADQHEELADETIQSWKPERRQRDDQEDAAEDGRDRS